ncbi:MAG: paraquat-inducible protein A [bacterium]|nr:paraquat-inducible protein A [Gammaproteobacteria bacterium]HIL94460.1 paraquat-inducible protein A [Pseudomonadales bacterium]
MSKSRRGLSLLIILVALGLLLPGVTKPVLTLTGTMEQSDLVDLGIDLIIGQNPDQRTRQMVTMMTSMLGLDRVEGQIQAYSITRSIWGTVAELADSGNLLVAFLVMLFSIIIPLLKLLMQLGYLIVSYAPVKNGLLMVINAISKWSMADVFVMALIVAYLAGRASGQMGDLLTMHSELEVGFYYFLAYCLFSIASTLLFKAVPASEQH